MILKTLYKDYMGLLTSSQFGISGGLGGFWKEGRFGACKRKELHDSQGSYGLQLIFPLQLLDMG